MSDRGDPGMCGTEGCFGDGDHELCCNDCGAVVGYLCDKCVNKLQRKLENGREVNTRRETERNNRQ